MKVYSPTSTERFLRCPRLYDRSKRWLNPAKDNWLDKLMGQAVHFGVQWAHVTGSGGLEAAAKFLEEKWEDQGLGVTLEACTFIVQKAVKKALGLNLAQGMTILHCEEPLGEEKCIPDLVLQGEQGIRIVDWKFTVSSGDWLIRKRLEEAETSWQLKHYAWRVQSLHPDIPVVEAGVALVVASPTAKAYWSPFEVTPALMLDWGKAARVWWRMEHAEVNGAYEPQFGASCTQFGGCPLYDGCYRLAGDESRYDTLYEMKGA